MTHFPAQIVTNGCALLADVEAWIEKTLRRGMYEWHGGFEVPADAKISFNVLTTQGLGIKLSDGRSGDILVTNYDQTWDIHTDPNHAPATVRFQGTGPLE